jgi:formimidoylglutamate deiminase
MSRIEVVHEPDRLRVPALATAHSHAFQRGMRGLAQRRSGVGAGKDDFWSWRSEMYRVATALTPESFEQITRVAYRELAAAGARTVGEFHYIHHQADGTPYQDRTLLADIAIRVAKEEGLRIALMRTAYFRGGPGKDAEPGQKRFCDPSVDAVLRDVDALRSKYASDPAVLIGLAPHSVRAVPPDHLREFVRYADAHKLMLHMHVSETDREVHECVAETKLLPVFFLESIGALSERFVAVHCTQVSEAEAAVLGRNKAFACICPTTERDLGDGLPNMTALRHAKARICTGIDSHIVTDLIEDMRSLETHERLRTKSRVTFMPEQDTAETPAEALWYEASHETARACGFADAGATIALNTADPALTLVDPARLLEAIVFSGTSRMVV